MRILIPLLLALSLALPAAAEPQVKPESEDDKALYTMGVAVGRNLASFGLDEREAALVVRGLQDRLLDRDLAVSFEEYVPKLNEFASRRNTLMAEREKEASQGFLTEAAAAPGAVKTESGLIYAETKAGSGPTPSPTDQVKVHYRGTLRDGRVFDSSRDRGEPATFAVNRVIPCWTEALQMMKVGGQAAIVCPSEIAYGERGTGAMIKPGAALRFEVELISID
jgi:FKBP-type peptidyl-prolyl cis-trans isomerase